MPPWKRKEKLRLDRDPPTGGQSITPQCSPKRPAAAIVSLLAVTRCFNEPIVATATSFDQPSDAVEKLAKQHEEFGPLGDSSHLYTSVVSEGAMADPVVDYPPYFIVLTTYISYLVLIFLGHFHDFLVNWFQPQTYKHLRPQNGYASLYNDFESFYTRRMKRRITDCFERPTTGVPGRHVTLLDRVTKDNVNF
ncbi:hypothetical protein BJX70DRAFT_400588 [Aspergillus crustosus]